MKNEILYYVFWHIIKASRTTRKIKLRVKKVDNRVPTVPIRKVKIVLLNKVEGALGRGPGS